MCTTSCAWSEKNRTVELFVCKIRQAYKDQTLSWTILYATFLSNIFYGSKPASPFEVSRGFTPRILAVVELRR
jgi:hypothetical protein